MTALAVAARHLASGTLSLVALLAPGVIAADQPPLDDAEARRVGPPALPAILASQCV